MRADRHTENLQRLLTRWSAARSIQVGIPTSRDSQPGSARSRIASKRKPQRRTDLVHPPWAELRDAFPQALLRNCRGIVKIHRAGTLHAIVFIQGDFRWSATQH